MQFTWGIQFRNHQDMEITETEQGLTFQVYVQPRSSKNQIVGVHGDALKVRLTAPPVDGAANAMCVQYLAKCLGMPKSAVEIVSGQTSRTKRILVLFPQGPVTPVAKGRLMAAVRKLAEVP